MGPMPETMRAVVVRQPGGPEVLELATVPLPTPGKGEVRVRVAASGLNRADLVQRRGQYPAPPGWPQDIPGLEFSGTVVEVPWPAGTYPRAAVLAAINERTGVICVVTPNNPTGAVATFEDVKAVSEAAPHAVVLLGQDGRRHEHRHLVPRVDRLERGADRQLRLAESHVTAQQPIHRPGMLHVGFDCVNRSQLVGRFLVGKRRVELALPG